ncbi:hypothetical protein TNIN_278841 [Trichonephila inaurata madagascariensis]|uniref:Uncharacterized protein n=1 Tax=Trichonephila inaurata madagascariensis TaxID=2747483 RepID=A0A8X6Y1F0_9ARAC|nr:hypothetical protein TNIN_278841 [Trichonephila inaurata madagascariensis]
MTCCGGTHPHENNQSQYHRISLPTRWLVDHFRAPDVMAFYQNSVYFGVLRERGCFREKNYGYESSRECGSSLDPYPSHSWGVCGEVTVNMTGA